MKSTDLKLTMLGTGNSAMMPVYGCDCSACQQAQNQPQFRREKSSAYIEHNGRILLLDANAPDLMQRFPAGSIDRILLTHYHMDHVSALFDLRWGKAPTLPVISPEDEQGCDDLYKYPGMLDFSQRIRPFESFVWQQVTITALPLNHSRPCLGYAFEWQGGCIAYLTDTNGLPEETASWLKERKVDWIVTDCNYPPIECEQTRLSKNHNDIIQTKAIFEQCQPSNIGLMHVSHDVIIWANQNPEQFTPNFQILSDGQEITL
ncbi:phosphonate metabolism protein PhnP [Vibrio hippocampi]|uniref:Phosphoribosyl 1,2-cyclic phosphate phosphodiesterase n=1 Tax=Vibrio hippocampi TaxID=654686 RepID=A0ABM8ZP73_9VIBR|nr:phosphonate metabolism protein PhnP [Vibrio hippocampi]CAH0530283.1 Phosphoribosyl 1,2-cyclic phosphate phosphodiesterase [Vibrio hippocampi]